MRNLNEYNQEYFEENFSGSAIASQVRKDFDKLFWDKHVDFMSQFPTQREQLGSRSFSMVSFYYIQYLLEKNPSQIIDMGCGWNVFKRYVPSIIGVSPDECFGDETDYFDDDYVANHKDCYESAMAICSLNYTPLTKIKKTVEDFISIVKPGGRGFIALDISPMLASTDPSQLDNVFGTENPTVHEIDDYVRKQLSNLPCNYLVFDIDSAEIRDDIDGQVRIVFEREA
jgi:hypothetical protein